MVYQVESFNKWLYPDDKVSLNPKKNVELIAPRGGYASFQILLNDCIIGERISCSVTGDGAFFAEFYREIDVQVSMNTGVRGFTADYETAKEYVTKRAPFRVFDALEPITESEVKNSTQALYICFKIDESAVQGLYSCIVNVKIGEIIELPVEVEVIDTVLPKESLYITNWFSLHNMARAHNKKLWTFQH